MAEAGGRKGLCQFPLSIQLSMMVEEDKRDFEEVLYLVSKYGCTGVELNIVKPQETDPEALKMTLDKYGIKMTYLASGAFARKEGLSLSHPDLDKREYAVDRCKQLILFAQKMQSGVILGFIKGGISADKAAATARFTHSLEQLEKLAAREGVPLLVEATNRYETSVANTLEEAVEIIKDIKSPILRVLPDTFHMNIEEQNMLGALAKYLPYCDSLHISDNNRLFPGFGSINFKEIFSFLKCVGYNGGIAVEGNLLRSWEHDFVISVEMLSSLLSIVKSV